LARPTYFQVKVNQEIKSDQFKTYIEKLTQVINPKNNIKWTI